MVRLAVATACLLLTILETPSDALAPSKPEATPHKLMAAQRFAGAAALAAVTVTTPLVSQAAVETSPTAVSINVDANSLATSAFNNRSELKQAVTSYLAETNKLNNDIANILPADAVSVNAPSDLKAAAKNALSGQGEVIVNGSPVNLQVESEKGALTVKISSDVLPKVPFLAPVPGTSVSNVVLEETNDNVAVATATPQADNGLLDRTVHFDVGDGYDFSYKQIAGVSSLSLGAAYGLSYTYYVAQRKQEEEEAAARKAKAAAAKAAAAAKKKKEAEAKKAAAEAKAAVTEDTIPAAQVAITGNVIEEEILATVPEVANTPTDTISEVDEETPSGRRLKRFLGLKRETVTN